MTVLVRAIAVACLSLLSACAFLSPEGGDVVDKAQQQALLQEKREILLVSQHQAVLGNPQGDVTIVEFMDYNCGFCKIAARQLAALVEEDRQLRVVLKEWPIFGAMSTAVAKISIAARMQDGGPRFQAFHEALLTAPGRATQRSALAAAQAAGYDVARIESDASSDEVEATLDEVKDLAQSLGFRGTPTFVVGTEVILGKVRPDAMKAALLKAREACAGQQSC